MKKGMAITGLILGITGMLVSATGFVFSMVALFKKKVK